MSFGSRPTISRTRASLGTVRVSRLRDSRRHISSVVLGNDSLGVVRVNPAVGFMHHRRGRVGRAGACRCPKKCSYQDVVWRRKCLGNGSSAHTTKSDAARQLNLMLGPGRSGQLFTLRRFARHSNVAGRRLIIRLARRIGLGPKPDAAGRCCRTSKAFARNRARAVHDSPAARIQRGPPAAAAQIRTRAGAALR